METPATWKSRSQCGNYGQGQRAFQALKNELSKSPLANASSRYVYVQVLRTLQIGRRPRVDDSGRESLRTLASVLQQSRNVSISAKLKCHSAASLGAGAGAAETTISE